VKYSVAFPMTMPLQISSSRKILRRFPDGHAAPQTRKNAQEDRDSLAERKRAQAHQEGPYGENCAWEAIWVYRLKQAHTAKIAPGKQFGFIDLSRPIRRRLRLGSNLGLSTSSTRDRPIRQRLRLGSNIIWVYRPHAHENGLHAEHCAWENQLALL
jgi:hypothetical protein